MFNTHINDRLNQWAQWTMLKGSAGLGYPHQCAFTRLAGCGEQGAHLPPDLNEMAWEIEQAVQVLPPLLREAVFAFYLGTSTTESRAKQCHCSVRTMYRRVDEAQSRLMDWLNGYYCRLDEYDAVVRKIEGTQKSLQAA
jgi:DNA-directed RNA polymerase specialized sigma24 family protein